MSAHAFFAEASKIAVRAAIERIEKQTCAEVVVTVRRQAGVSYRDADLAFGAFVGLVALMLLLFLPKEFSTAWMPIDVVVSFGIGFVSCRQTSALRRLLVPRARRQAETRRAASAAFHEMGIGRTSGRHGILVLVGVFEREAAVVADVGVDPALISEAAARIEEAVARANPSVDAFVAALESIGPALAPTMPCRGDDVNELPDEVGVG